MKPFLCRIYAVCKRPDFPHLIYLIWYLTFGTLTHISIYSSVFKIPSLSFVETFQNLFVERAFISNVLLSPPALSQIVVLVIWRSFEVGGGLNDPKLPKTKKSKCYQTFLGAVLCIKAGENFEFGERWCLTPCTWGLKIWKSPLKIEISKLFYHRHVGCLSRGIEGTCSKITFFLILL